MRIKPEQLANALQKNLASVYLLSGDEPLQLKMRDFQNATFFQPIPVLIGQILAMPRHHFPFLVIKKCSICAYPVQTLGQKVQKRSRHIVSIYLLTPFC